MVFDINDYTYIQSNNRFYVGDINLEEKIKFKCDYIVVGNIETEGMLIAMGSLIVIGNIKASSVFINEDLFCTGCVISKSIDIDGENIVLNQTATEKEYKLDIPIEESILKLFYQNIIYYGYNLDDIEIIKYEEKYYINLYIEEDDINCIFLGYLNKVIKSISKEMNDIEIYMNFNESIENLVSKLLNIQIKDLDVEYENKTIKINTAFNKINFDNLNKSKALIEYLYDCTIVFEQNTNHKDESIDGDYTDVDININNLIKNINDILDEKNKELFVKNEEESNTLSKQIRFQLSEIKSTKLVNLESNIEKDIFYYVKYNKKIYINSDHIFKILGLQRSYKSLMLSDFIVVNYEGAKENNIVKFYDLNNYYNFIIEISKKYKTLGLDDKIIVALYNTIYNLDLNSKDIKNSIPLWSKVVDKLLKNITEEELKNKLKISDKELNELKQGYTQSRCINKSLKKLYEQYCSKLSKTNNKIIEIIKTEMDKKKYNLDEIKVHRITYQEGKKCTVYIKSNQFAEKMLKEISDKINSSNNEFIINLQLYKSHDLREVINKYKINTNEKKVRINFGEKLEIGQEIIHDIYGKGIIVKLDNNNITIKFNDHKNVFDINYLINNNLIKRVEYYFYKK